VIGEGNMQGTTKPNIKTGIKTLMDNDDSSKTSNEARWWSSCNMKIKIDISDVSVPLKRTDNIIYNSEKR
jgi:hypothetical protein